MKILQRIKVQLQFNIADKSKKQNTYLVQYYMLKKTFLQQAVCTMLLSTFIGSHSLYISLSKRQC